MLDAELSMLNCSNQSTGKSPASFTLDKMMRIESNEGDGKILVALDDLESTHLLTYLFHAKFCDDVRLDLVGSPSLRTLISGLSAVRRQLGFDPDTTEYTTIREGGGEQAPSSFRVIETRLKALLRRDDISAELAEDLYPYVWERSSTEDRVIMQGARVLVPNSEHESKGADREVGIVLACWQDPDTREFLCYVARTSSASLYDVPSEPPVIVKHWARNLIET